MSDDPSEVPSTATQEADRRMLAAALVVNVLMFCVGLVGWRLAKSAALLADALDMLADASGYAVAYVTGVVIAGFVIREGWELWESGACDDEEDPSA